MPNLKKLVKELSKPGPHKVLRGDLAVAGVPGQLWTPAAGSALPSVVFAHDWMVSAGRYSKLLRHLASWGIVAAAPNTEWGIRGQEGRLAGDLLTAATILSEVRLGSGQISVRRGEFAVAGHGFGAAAAVIAAATTPVAITALAALYPTPTQAAILTQALSLPQRSLVLSPDSDHDSVKSAAGDYAKALDVNGSAVLRAVEDGSGPGLAEGASIRGFLGAGGSDRHTQALTRALLTGFLLGTIGGDKKYSDFVGRDDLPGAPAIPLDALEAEPNLLAGLF